MTSSILSGLPAHTGLVSISTRFFILFNGWLTHFATKDVLSFAHRACLCTCMQLSEQMNMVLWGIWTLCSRTKQTCRGPHYCPDILVNLFFYDFVIGNNMFEVLSLKTFSRNILSSAGHLANGNSSPIIWVRTVGKISYKEVVWVCIDFFLQRGKCWWKRPNKNKKIKPESEKKYWRKQNRFILSALNGAEDLIHINANVFPEGTPQTSYQPLQHDSQR